MEPIVEKSLAVPEVPLLIWDVVTAHLLVGVGTPHNIEKKLSFAGGATAYLVVQARS